MEDNHTNQLLCSCGVGVECHRPEERPDLLLDACVEVCPHAWQQEMLRCVPEWASMLNKSIMLFQQ